MGAVNAKNWQRASAQEFTVSGKRQPNWIFDWTVLVHARFCGIVYSMVQKNKDI
jgi:hypothetical protein